MCLIKMCPVCVNHLKSCPPHSTILEPPLARMGNRSQEIKTCDSIQQLQFIRKLNRGNCFSRRVAHIQNTDYIQSNTQQFTSHQKLQDVRLTSLTLKIFNVFCVNLARTSDHKVAIQETHTKLMTLSIVNIELHWVLCGFCVQGVTVRQIRTLFIPITYVRYAYVILPYVDLIWRK